MDVDYPIDFVITWLDATDENWLAVRRQYKSKSDESGGAVRYRDWELLKYWFRGVDKYAPWVNKVFFVTYGHVPNWLNTDHEKLVIVKHEDFMPPESLPTFNSNAIELCFNRISELSEHFVYFNDDTLLVNKVSKDDFFVNGLPVDRLAWNAVSAKVNGSMIEHIVLNDMEILESYFDKKSIQKDQFWSLVNPKNGAGLVKTLLLWPFKHFTGIENPHVAQAYLKSTLEEVWNAESDRLMSTVCNRFRTMGDYSLWLARYWNLLKGNYNHKSRKTEMYFELSNDNHPILDTIKSGKCKTVCLNDNDQVTDFDRVKSEVLSCFDSLLHDMSSFER